LPYKVLVCDDESLEREVLSIIIERSGLPLQVVGVARDGYEAVEKTRELLPDIVLMDIKMPCKDGLSASNEIKSINPNIKIIIITAYDEFDFAKEALRMGAEDYLLKPVRPEEICTVLQKIVELYDEEKKKQARDRELREAIKRAGKLLRSSILATMLLGDYEDDAVIKAQAELLDIDRLPDSILVVEADLDASTPGAELERYEIFRQIEQICAELDIEFILPLSEEMVIGIISSKTEPRYMAEQIRKGIEEKMQTTVTVGVGEDAGNLKKVYREACMAAKLGKFYLGGNRIITGDMLEDLMGSEEDVSFEEEEELLDAVRRWQEDRAGEIMEDVLKKLVSSSRGSIIFCQTRLAELTGLVWRTARQAGLIGQKNWHLDFSHLQKLGRCQSISSLRSWCRSFIEDVFAENNREPAKRNLVKQAAQYIKENYNRELSLAEIAGLIYINPDYFSKLFKKEMGCTYAEYLTRTRVEEARKFLTNPSLTIAEVGKKVGYADPNYFSKVFKKIVGLPPTEYRQRIGITEKS
jgi:two-component system response regulator YesN